MPAILRLRQFAHDELGMVFAYALIMPTIHLHAYLHVYLYAYLHAYLVGKYCLALGKNCLSIGKYCLVYGNYCLVIDWNSSNKLAKSLKDNAFLFLVRCLQGITDGQFRPN